MSSNFLEFLEDDKHGHSVTLDMNAAYHAFLSVMDKEGSCSSYHFTPDEEGRKRAKMIAQSLMFWVEHSKSIGEL